MDFRNYIPPDGGHVGCGIWQSRSLIRDPGCKGNKWTKKTALRRRVSKDKVLPGPRMGGGVVTL